ncbi:Complement factor H H factor 1 Precursor [Channa argus]|uniref:Complement factor H H factor 1 n=1 Tax=Channa argus TaxID=215402 RepID=A0A6G1PK39_CHAAH|nr:Complement factor H H factor 1 Precursor [Channa argus]
MIPLFNEVLRKWSYILDPRALTFRTYDITNIHHISNEARTMCVIVSSSFLMLPCRCLLACSQLPVVPHAQVSEDTRKDGYQLGDVIHFTCEAGYTSDLILKYVCLMQGWLEVHYGKCYFQASGCEPPPADGHLTITGLPENHEPMLPDHVLVFSCDDPGKYMNGSSVLICGKDGQWNHPFPSCKAIKCKLEVSQLEGFRYEPAHRNVFSPGETLRVTCKKRDWILNRSTVITCRDDGQWTSDPTCKAVKCKVPQIEHGTVTGDIRDYNEHEILHFECNARYGKTEERPSKCTKIGQRADWSPTPTCEPIKCRLEVSQLEGFTYEPAHRNEFSPGETLRVTFEEKYWIFTPLENSTVVTCRDDGQWTSEPILKEVTCSRPNDQHISYWENDYQQKKTLGDTVRYSCTSGYKSTNGTTRATCTRDGWTPDPLCQAPSGCGKPPPLTDGDTRFTSKYEYNHNDRVEYVCKNYYTMRGEPFKICNNGDWTGSITCLRPCTVDKEIMLKHNIAFLYSGEEKLYSPHQTYITFRCTGRTRHVGTVSMRQQCIDGVISLPTCQ